MKNLRRVLPFDFTQGADNSQWYSSIFAASQQLINQFSKVTSIPDLDIGSHSLSTTAELLLILLRAFKPNSHTDFYTAHGKLAGIHQGKYFYPIFAGSVSKFLKLLI
jgi:hypothetical protein